MKRRRRRRRPPPREEKQRGKNSPYSARVKFMASHHCMSAAPNMNNSRSGSLYSTARVYEEVYRKKGRELLTYCYRLTHGATPTSSPHNSNNRKKPLSETHFFVDNKFRGGKKSAGREKKTRMGCLAYRFLFLRLLWLCNGKASHLHF